MGKKGKRKGKRKKGNSSRERYAGGKGGRGERVRKSIDHQQSHQTNGLSTQLGVLLSQLGGKREGQGSIPPIKGILVVVGERVRGRKGKEMSTTNIKKKNKERKKKKKKSKKKRKNSKTK